jgi:hypothetical protein
MPNPTFRHSEATREEISIAWPGWCRGFRLATQAFGSGQPIAVTSRPERVWQTNAPEQLFVDNLVQAYA